MNGALLLPALALFTTVLALWSLWQLVLIRQRIRYLEALIARDWDTVDEMMGISDAQKAAFAASDGSGVYDDEPTRPPATVYRPTAPTFAMPMPPPPPAKDH